MHKHHIMPRHLGGSNNPDNLVEVSVEQHAEIHRCLWVYGGRWQDEIAWRTLSGQIGRVEAQRMLCREIGKKNKGRTGRPSPNKGKKNPGVSASNKRRTPWNKGLTKDDPRVAMNISKMVHNGMLGKHHAAESKLKMTGRPRRVA